MSVGLESCSIYVLVSSQYKCNYKAYFRFYCVFASRHTKTSYPYKNQSHKSYMLFMSLPVMESRRKIDWIFCMAFLWILQIFYFTSFLFPIFPTDSHNNFLRGKCKVFTLNTTNVIKIIC